MFNKSGFESWLDNYAQPCRGCAGSIRFDVREDLLCDGYVFKATCHGITAEMAADYYWIASASDVYWWEIVRKLVQRLEDMTLTRDTIYGGAAGSGKSSYNYKEYKKLEKITWSNELVDLRTDAFFEYKDPLQSTRGSVMLKDEGAAADKVEQPDALAILAPLRKRKLALLE